jgi:hypothetical protein
MKVLLIRGGKGIGDLLFTTPIPRLLHEQGHTVDVAVHPENEAVYLHNPHVGALVPYPTQESDYVPWQDQVVNAYDLILPLGESLEKKYLHRTDAFFGPVPSLEERRAAAAGKNYINETVKLAGFEPEPDGYFLPELYPSKEEAEILNRYRDEIKASGKKIIFWNLAGSTKNKTIVKGFKYIEAVLAQVPDSFHWIVNGRHCVAANMPNDPRVQQSAWDLRTSMLLTGLVDVVVGPESALVNAAGAYDTPKVILYSHSAPENLGAGYKNHYPVCPECDCHPCYLLTLEWFDLWDPVARNLARQQDLLCRYKTFGDPYRSMGYHCTWTLPDKQIIDTVVKILT